MKKIIVAGVFLLLAALILSAFPRYEIVSIGGGSSVAFRLDRWTGEVVVFRVMGEAGGWRLSRITESGPHGPR